MTIEMETLEGEEIFEKPTTKDKTKPKKTLSEGQKAALAKGRATVARKREEKKLEAEAKKVNAVGEKASVALKKEGRKEKKGKVKEQELLGRLIDKEKGQKRQKKIDRYEDTKLKMLEKIEDSATFSKLQSVLDDVTEEDIVDDDRLEKKLTEKYRLLLKE